ncbi:MAG: hypothetical protein BKP49_05550 [Treponema sp. CETP13]|nr:MAG: hypothetical protein BKP49_05550 [Treponema sp. CETP13]
MKKKFLWIATFLLAISLVLVSINIINRNSQKSTLLTRFAWIPSRTQNISRSRNIIQGKIPKMHSFKLQSLIITQKENSVYVSGKFIGGIVNPYLLKKNFTINDIPLLQSDKIQYNKKGTMFRIFLNSEMARKIIESNEFSIGLRNVRSLKNEPLINEEIKNIEINQLYIFKEDGTWYKY